MFDKEKLYTVVEEFEDKSVQLLTDMGETDSFESKDAPDELFYLLNLSRRKQNHTWR